MCGDSTDQKRLVSHIGGQDIQLLQITGMEPGCVPFPLWNRTSFFLFSLNMHSFKIWSLVITLALASLTSRSCVFYWTNEGFWSENVTSPVQGKMELERKFSMGLGIKGGWSLWNCPIGYQCTTFSNTKYQMLNSFEHSCQNSDCPVWDSFEHYPRFLPLDK